MDSAKGGYANNLDTKLAYLQASPSLNEKNRSRAEADKKSRQMARAQHYLFFTLLLCLLSIGVLATTFNKSVQNVGRRISPEKSQFQQLLNAIDPSALHEVLHENAGSKARRSLYQEDKDAMEALHERNAELAESLIELAKRQSGNTTVITTTAVTTTQVTTTDTTTPSAPVSTPAESQTTPTPTSQQQTSVPESTPQSSPDSSPVASTAPSSSPSTPTGSPTPPGTTPSTTASGSSGPVSTPTSNTTPTSTGSSFPVTSDRPSSSASSTFGSTSNSDTASSVNSGSSDSQSITRASRSTRTTTYTTTLPGGSVSLVTAVTVVTIGADQTNPGSGSTPTSDGNASLQTGGVKKVEVGLSAVLGSAAMMFLHVL